MLAGLEVRTLDLQKRIQHGFGLLCRDLAMSASRADLSLSLFHPLPGPKPPKSLGCRHLVLLLWVLLLLKPGALFSKLQETRLLRDGFEMHCSVEITL